MGDYFSVRYGDIVVLLYHEDMEYVRYLLYENSRREKTLKRFLEYCYMTDVKVALEPLKGDKTQGLKSAIKYVTDHDMSMSAEQIRDAINHM